MTSTPRPLMDAQNIHALRAAALRALPRASVFVFDHDLRVLMADGQALRSHGYDPDALVGRHLADVIPAASYGHLEPEYRAALGGEQRQFDYLAADGEHWYAIDATPLRADDDTVTGVMVISQDITSRRAAEAALETHRQWLQDILDSLGMPVSVKDADARFALVNSAYTAGVGKSRDELVGRTVDEVYPAEFADAFAADDARALQEGVTVHEERPAPWHDGSVRTLAMSRSPLRREDGTIYGLCAAGIDITERKRAEEELRTLTRQFEATFEAAAIGMALVGLDGRFLRVNRGLCELTGYPERELLDLTFQDITHPDDLDADLAQAQRLLEGEIDRYTIEKRYFTREGDEIWILLSGAIVRDDAGEPLHFVAQIQDISERKRMVARLEELVHRDSLTGLLNRRRFEDDLHRQIARCRRYDEHATLLILDVDRFKLVNDTFGHGMGDAALRSVADVLTSRLRASDLGARIGGDEFAVLLLNASDEQARTLAEEVRAAIRDTPVQHDGLSTRVTVSVGLERLDRQTASDKDALTAADGAMYAAKAAGRDRVAVAGDD